MCCTGGPFALYSLLCRHAKFSLLPNQQAADEELSTYYQPGTGRTAVSSPFKRFLEKHRKLRTCLLLFVLFSACMVIGDGVLTPTISGMHFMSQILYFVFHFIQLSGIFFSPVTSNVVRNVVLSAISGLQDPATSGLSNGMHWFYVFSTVCCCLLATHCCKVIYSNHEVVLRRCCIQLIEHQLAEVQYISLEFNNMNGFSQLISQILGNVLRGCTQSVI